MSNFVTNKRFITPWIIILVGFLSLCNTSSGQEPDTYTLQKVDAFEEIANREITSILQDKEGFLWMGTYFGILKYDGNEIVNIKPNIYDPGSIPARKIKRLLQVGDTIWIGTIEKGLCYYDCVRETFHTLPEITARGPGSNQVTALTTDVHGNIWTGTSKGLYRVNQGDPKDISAIEFKQGEDYRGKNWINDLTFDQYNNLWVGTSNGIYFIHQSHLNRSSGFTAIPFKMSGRVSNNSENLITSLACIPDGDNVCLWVGTKNGIFKYRINPHSLNSSISEEVTGNYTSLDEIYGLFENVAVQTLLHNPKKEELWIGTSEKVILLDLISLKISGDFGTVLNQNLRVSSIYKDNNESVWIGALSGLHRIVTEKSLFNTIGEVNSIEGTQYISTLIDHGDEYLCGTLSNGLFKVQIQGDGSLGEMEPVTMKSRERSNMIRDIVCGIKDKNGFIWLGTKGNGLISFKFEKGTVTEWKHYDPENPENPFPQDIQSLAEHPDGSILVGTYSQSIIKLDPQSDAMMRIDKFSVSGEHPADYPISDIFIESERVFWVGTRGGGLYRIILTGGDTFEYQGFLNSEGDLNSLCDNYIIDIYLDHFGGLWLGTEGGLSLFNRIDNQFKNFYEINGLSDNCIQGVIEDSEGYLWATTINGLNRINVRELLDSSEQGAIDIFNKEDGLPTNYFIHGSAFKLHNNLLFMGNLRGATYFDPTSVEPKDKSSNPVIKALFLQEIRIRTGERVNGRILLNGRLSTLDFLELKAKENNIAIAFSAPNFENPSRIKYEYRLKGYNDHWTSISPPNLKVNYLNFPAGEYTFEVRASNADGSWNQNHATLQIKRSLPLWRSPFAYLFYALILLGVFVLFRKMIMQRSEWLNKIKLESYQSEKNEELLQHKLRFFTNISHEIKTPLTLILGPVKQALNSHETSDHLYALRLVQRNANRLLRLTNQLLEFRKVETENVSLSVSMENIGALTRSIGEDCHYYANEKQISLDLAFVDEQLEGCIDRDKYEKILFNLLSNAIKYTGSNGTIQVRLNGEYQSDDGVKYAVCIVEDTGRGIPEDQINRIFERYYHAGQKNSGIGIGLALTKKLVEIHKGTISVQSVLGEGTIFQVNLPIDQNFFDPDELAEKEVKPESERSYIFESEPDDLKESESTPINGEKILIVEDDPELRQFLNHTFKREYGVLSAEDGEEGYKRALHEKPDVIIADFRMPKLNGLELYNKLKEHHSTENIPYILLTAHLDKQVELELSQAGADLILNKPFDPDLLKIQVKNMLRKHKKIKTHLEKEIQINKSGNTRHEKKKSGISDKVLAIIDEHCSKEAFNIDFLAQEMDMSRIQLYRYIKKHFKMSPFELIRKIRMSKVASSLREGDANISEVAYRFGFNDMKNFRESFKKEYGQTPTDYIKANK